MINNDTYNKNSKNQLNMSSKDHWPLIKVTTGAKPEKGLPTAEFETCFEPPKQVSNLTRQPHRTRQNKVHEVNEDLKIKLIRSLRQHNRGPTRGNTQGPARKARVGVLLEPAYKLLCFEGKTGSGNRV